MKTIAILSIMLFSMVGCGDKEADAMAFCKEMSAYGTNNVDNSIIYAEASVQGFPVDTEEQKRVLRLATSIGKGAILRRNSDRSMAAVMGSTYESPGGSPSRLYSAACFEQLK